MSRFQKIFLAALLVVVGFGVAKFLGQPVLPTQANTFRSMSPAMGTVGDQKAVASINSPQAAGHVRLLPDLAMTHAAAPATNSDAALSQPPRLGSTLAPVLLPNEKLDTPLNSRLFDFAPSSSARIGGPDPPRAQLRNEAPRPVSVDAHSPAAIHRPRSENVHVPDPGPVGEDKVAPPTWSAPHLLNTGYTESGPAPTNTMPASYTMPVNSLTENQLAPPPWPAPNDTAEPRTHVVVDGDSLERLASRYLSDPQRSREIYELNRELLSAPDLLPIGAELKIPERLASPSWDRRGFQPNSANAGPSSQVAGENMTRARPASAPQEIIPRAQLAPPVMVQ